jgi:nucleoside-diphosphate-sugar epimerase
VKVFLTGATGYLGSAVLNRLLAEGHSVVAHLRSPSAASGLAGGVRSAVGDLSNRAFIAEQLRDVDAVVHTASPNDETSAAVDSQFLAAVLPVLAGSSRAFVYTAGTWVHGSGSGITEDAAYAPPPIVAWRPALIDRVRAASADDVRTVVISPANLYGNGGGIPALLARGPVTGGREPALHIVGGTQHFPNVHRDDISQLYTLAANTASNCQYLWMKSSA